jgi:hypothetical protein
MGWERRNLKQVSAQTSLSNNCIPPIPRLRRLQIHFRRRKCQHDLGTFALTISNHPSPAFPRADLSLPQYGFKPWLLSNQALEINENNINDEKCRNIKVELTRNEDNRFDEDGRTFE